MIERIRSPEYIYSFPSLMLITRRIEVHIKSKYKREFTVFLMKLGGSDNVEFQLVHALIVLQK